VWQIEKLSDGLGECLNLKKLYLGENFISRLPDTLGNLTRMTILDLRYFPTPGDLLPLSARVLVSLVPTQHCLARPV